MNRVRLMVLGAAVVLVLSACGTGGLSDAEESWCRTDLVALSDDAVAVAFERINGEPMLEVMKGSFGYSESEGAQVGSRMTVTNRGGFPTLEARDAWYASDEYVEACRAAYDAYR